MQGRSLRHLLSADADHHEAVLYGGFGKDVCLTDGRYRYFRQALPESWVHHHTMMPRGSQDFLAVNRLQVEYGYFLKYPSDRGYPQLRWRQPSEPALDAPRLQSAVRRPNRPRSAASRARPGAGATHDRPPPQSPDRRRSPQLSVPTPRPMTFGLSRQANCCLHA